MSVKTLYQTNKHYLEILMNFINTLFQFYHVEASPPTPPDMNPPNSYKKLPSHETKVTF